MAEGKTRGRRRREPMEGVEELSPSKRLKPLIETLTPAPPPSSKGKEKIEVAMPVDDDDDDQEEDVTCGICLSEGGQSIRGRIDSCNHYFCFVCIMEWSKVESRCPMCKQRFGSIRRLPVQGLFLRERVVSVPVRDQVYHPDGNETAQFNDPYAEVNCVECQKSVDEHLLLLCDLCDSAAHTYCVGLGATVPEGDWFCPDCTITRKEHSKTEIDDGYCTQDSHKDQSRYPISSSTVSISDIVADEASPGLSLSYVQSFGQQTNNDRVKLERISAQIESRKTLLNSERSSTRRTQITEILSCSEAKIYDQGARTLRRCRDLHGRIQTLRENWNALRRGSLSFASDFDYCGSMNGDRKQQQNRRVNSGISRNPQILCLNKPEQMTVENSVSNEHLGGTSSQDVERAWKMMEAAKSIRKIHRGGDCNSRAAKSSIKMIVLRDTRELKSGPVVPKGKALEDKVSVSNGSGMHCRQQSLKTVPKECKSKNNDQQKPDNLSMKQQSQNHKGSLDIHSLQNCNLPLSKQDPKSVYPREEEKSHQDMCKGSILVDGQDMPASCPGSFTCAFSFSAALPIDKAEQVQNSQCKMRPLEVKQAVQENADKSSTSGSYSAKSEVQSLVKLNLKLQLIHHHLGVDRFKEVARLSTHTILAACGLEHSKSSVRPFPNSVCRHPEETRHLRRSNLMPNSCRECFFSFVRDVVSSIASEKAVLPSTGNKTKS